VGGVCAVGMRDEELAGGRAKVCRGWDGVSGCLL
jgi:hypothetical protein